MTIEHDGKPGAVVITGASTGIGRACALELNRIGFRVFAGVRNDADGTGLKEASSGRITPVMLDVTDHGSISAAAETVAQVMGDGGIRGLVNNAGIVVGGPFEFLPLDDMRRQFEVNFFGQIAVTRAFLPLLRKGRGRIVNMGSISGRVVTPFVGPYGASKHALEALSDALRVELMPWDIEVALIEPGSIATPIWKKSVSAAAAAVYPAQARELYGNAMLAVQQAALRKGEEAIPVSTVVQAVVHAVTAARPKTRYLVGRGARIQALFKKFLPDRLLDRLIMRRLRLPSPQKTQKNR